EVERQRAGEREWQPNLMIAARFRPDFGGDNWELGLTLGGMQVVRRALPLIPLEALTIGYGHLGGQGRLTGRAEMAFLMPIWDRVGIGLAPVVAAFDCGDSLSSCHGDLLTQSVRLSIISDHGIWIDVSGPEYSWIDEAWIDRIGF